MYSFWNRLSFYPILDKYLLSYLLTNQPNLYESYKLNSRCAHSNYYRCWSPYIYCNPQKACRFYVLTKFQNFLKRFPTVPESWDEANYHKEQQVPPFYSTRLSLLKSPDFRCSESKKNYYIYYYIPTSTTTYYFWHIQYYIFFN